MKKAMNAFYAQSGGVTAVINATACGVIETSRKNKQVISNVYAGRNGIIGALTEDMIDTNKETKNTIHNLQYMPGGVFGSARYKLKGIKENKAEYKRLIEVFKAHNIGYFFYNGGNDSMDTANKISIMGKDMGFPIVSLGIPKTVDNDLPITDNCPGFGSVAKYIAISTQEAALDVASMSKTSTKVFILEVMGRHAGWIASAAGLVKKEKADAPHIILFPEVPFDKKRFLSKVKESIKKYDYCVIVASEGTRYKNGSFLSDTGNKDAFGHAQLGGVAPILAQMISKNLNLKYHYAIADYLQRSARHIASQLDVKQAYAVGQAAVEMAIKGNNAVMPVIKRTSNKPYRWKIDKTDLSKVANKEKMLPKRYISKDGYAITKSCRDYLEPLIRGESYPPYEKGLPKKIKLKNISVRKLLNKKFMV